LHVFGKIQDGVHFILSINKCLCWISFNFLQSNIHGCDVSESALQAPARDPAPLRTGQQRLVHYNRVSLLLNGEFLLLIFVKGA